MSATNSSDERRQGLLSFETLHAIYQYFIHSHQLVLGLRSTIPQAGKEQSCLRAITVIPRSLRIEDHQHESAYLGICRVDASNTEQLMAKVRQLAMTENYRLFYIIGVEDSLGIVSYLNYQEN